MAWKNGMELVTANKLFEMYGVSDRPRPEYQNIHGNLGRSDDPTHLCDSNRGNNSRQMVHLGRSHRGDRP